MNITAKINQNFNDMTKSERQVASYFQEHSDDFAFYTLDRISDEIGISTTSVIRFCRRLGFTGYKTFQETLRTDVKYQHADLPHKYQRTLDINNKDELLSQIIQRSVHCIQQTFHNVPNESLASAVRYIMKAQKVFTFGMRESFALAHYTYTRFQTIRVNVSLLKYGYNGDVESVLSLTPNDVCIVYLFHRYTKQTLQILPMLKNQGVKIILVTSAPYENIETYATVLLSCDVNINGIKNSAIAPICLADYLCNAVAVLNGEETLEYMKEIEELFKTNSILGS